MNLVYLALAYPTPKHIYYMHSFSFKWLVYVYICIKIEMKGDSDGKQQKCVEQETAYSAVVVNVSPSLPISFLHVSMSKAI